MKEEADKMTKTVERMRELGITIPDDVVKALEEVNSPIAKVVFVGRFQVGKSHAINEAILNQGLLLKEGVGLCTTAVSMEIAYGDVPRLTITYKNGEAPKIIENPRAEDIRAATTGSDACARLQLAAAVKSVRLEWPCVALKDMTVYDTAGIDDPNPELLRMTTYDTIPKADVAVMVVHAKVLSDYELAFLSRDIFACGIRKVLLLVSYRDEDALSEDARAELLESIRGQLSGVGRENVPVEMICYNPEVTGDIINTPEGVRERICAFAKEAAVANRITKLRLELGQLISNRLRELQFKRSLDGKSDAEVALVQADLANGEAELREVLAEMEDTFDATLHALRVEESAKFGADCQAIGRSFISDVETCADLADAQKHLKKANEILMPQIESTVVRTFDDVRTRVSNELKKCNAKLVRICEGFKVPSVFNRPTFDIDGGWFGDVNATFVTIGDYLLSILLIPGGVFFGWAARFICGKLPYFKDLVPSALVKQHVVNVARDSMSENVKKISSDFDSHLGYALEALKADVFKKIYAAIDEQKNVALRAMASRGTRLSEDDREKLDEEIRACGELYAEL